MQIDLNSDLGEGLGNDAAMLGIVSLAIVACGSHAGEPRGLLTTLREAARWARMSAIPTAAASGDAPWMSRPRT